MSKIGNVVSTVSELENLSQMRMIKLALKVLVIIVILGIATFITYKVYPELFFSHEEDITAGMVAGEIKKISEISTLRYFYKDIVEFKDVKKVLFLKSTASYDLIYSGIIKMGIDGSQIKVNVNKADSTIYITIPPAKILSHEIFKIKIRHESNGLFNDLQGQDYVKGQEMGKKSAEKEVINNKELLVDARNGAKTQIQAFMTMMPGIKNKWKIKFAD
ncbi:MAG: DUF4230 domain-containing protein [Ignavibacteria bacterium]|jgi:hypothetical protein|nr:DUF4230 domain-containing protein [Ignavibacteria bacterium]